MMTQDPEDLDAAVRSLSRLLLSEETLEETLDRVANLACRTLPGCDLASVTMIDDGRPSTPAQTDPVATDLDRAQYGSDHGPCLEAYSVRQVVGAPVAEQGESARRWPQFTTAAAQAGIRAVLAVPLVANERPVGALNIYSRTVDEFDDAEAETAALFSEQASIACANSEVYWRT